MSSTLSPLEFGILQLVASENWPGFRVDRLRARDRQNTGAGRYTYIDDDLGQQLTDGIYTAQGRMIDMEGVRNGLAFLVDVSGSRINSIEIAVYGNESWDGTERAWRIV